MANKVSFIIQLKDKFSKNAQRMNAQLKTVNSSTQKASSSLRKFGQTAQLAAKKAAKAIGKVGANLKSVGQSAKAFSLVSGAAVANSIRLYDKQVSAIAKVESGLKSTGGTVGLTAEQLKQAATQLQQLTRFGDEEILGGATSTLLTFTKITGKEFLKTQELTVDLAAKMGTDLQSAALQVGKALNDPIANLGALSRAGIQFDKQQQALIKGFAKSGQMQKAQAIILAELETQFGGTAEAMAKVGAGSLVQLSNSFGDLNEELGKASLELLLPVINKLNDLVAKFRQASPFVKKLVAAFGILITVAAPLLVLLGLIAIAVTAISLPVLAVTAAIIALGVAIAAVALNWDSIVDGMAKKWEGFTNKISNISANIKGFFGFGGNVESSATAGQATTAPKTPEKTAGAFNQAQSPDWAMFSQTAPVTQTAPVKQSGEVNGSIIVEAMEGMKVKSTKMDSDTNWLNIGLNAAYGN